jgi:SOS-response transcriptional repressor LexA
MARKRQEPTPRQIEVLHCIYTHMQQHHLCPTIRELMEMTRTSSTSVVNYQLLRLEQLGCIVRSTRMSRAISLTEKAFQYLNEKAPAYEVAAVPDYLVDEMRRLRTENAHFRGLQLNSSVIKQLQAQREHLERKYRTQIDQLEQERDRLIDDLVRLQMRSAS